MTVSNANMRYLEASINSASPEELIIKVYDALLLFARQAIDVMESRPADIQGRHDLLRRAQRACALLGPTLAAWVIGALRSFSRAPRPAHTQS